MSNRKSTAASLLLRQYRELTDPKKSIPSFHIHLEDDSNIFVWNIGVMVLNDDSIYHGGYFKAQMRFPDDFPFSPPQFRFTPAIYHPNVYRDGRLCISILHQSGDPMTDEPDAETWSPVQTVESVLISIVSLLEDPNISSPANVDAAVDYRKNPEQYKQRIKMEVERSKQDIPKGFVMPVSGDSAYISIDNQSKKQSNDSNSANANNNNSSNNTNNNNISSSKSTHSFNNDRNQNNNSSHDSINTSNGSNSENINDNQHNNHSTSNIGVNNNSISNSINSINYSKSNSSPTNVATNTNSLADNFWYDSDLDDDVDDMDVENNYGGDDDIYGDDGDDSIYNTNEKEKLNQEALIYGKENADIYNYKGNFEDDEDEDIEYYNDNDDEDDSIDNDSVMDRKQPKKTDTDLDEEQKVIQGNNIV